MIGRFAIDSRALSEPDGEASDARRDARRLAKHIHRYGLLAVLGPEDETELRAALRTQLAAGYDFWGPMLRALNSGGSAVSRAKPPLAGSARSQCEAGALGMIAPNAELLIVGESDSKPIGLTSSQDQALYDGDGVAPYDQGLELARAGRIDDSRTIERLEDLQKRASIPTGTPWDTAWDDYFAPLARVSREVNVFDRYLFSGLKYDKRKTGRKIEYLARLLQALDRDLPPKSTVNLFALNGEELKKNSPSAQLFTIDTIGEVLTRVRVRPREGRLHVYLSRHLDHDRHIRFSCGHAIKSGAGFDHLTFDDDGCLTQPFTYSHLRPGNDVDERAAYEEAARQIAEHWVFMSQREGFIRADI